MKAHSFKGWLVALLAAGLFYFPLSAQNPGGPPPGGGPGQGPGQGRGFQMTEEDIKARVDDLSQSLSLSEDQHKKILEYEMEFYNKMQIQFQNMRSQGGPPADREAMRENMQKMREERDQKYAEVLTKEQMEKYQQIQEQRRSEMRRQFQEGNPGEAPPATEERPARGRGRN